MQKKQRRIGTARLVSLLAAVLIVCGCAGSRVEYPWGICLIVDSQSVIDDGEQSGVHQVVDALIGRISPGDTIVVTGMPASPVDRADPIVRLTLDPRPLVTNAQKRSIRKQVHEWLDEASPDDGSDITAALLKAARSLRPLNAKRKTIILLTPLNQSPSSAAAGQHAFQMDGITVLALDGDAGAGEENDPVEAIERLRNRIESGGGTWRVANNLTQLAALL